MFDKKGKKKKTHSNETMKPHFKFIYTRKLFLNCKLLTMSSLQIIKTCQLYEWRCGKRKKLRKTKKNVGNTMKRKKMKAGRHECQKSETSLWIHSCLV